MVETEYERHVARLEKAIADKKIEDALLESKNVVASSKALLEFAEKEIENTGDETYKAEMQKVILEIKEHIPQFVKRISNLATQWNATQSWPEDESFSLDASIADITRAIAAFNNVVRNQHGVKDHIIPVVEAYEEPIAPVSESWKEEVQEVVAPVVQEPVALQVLIQEEETDDVVYIDEDAPALLSEAEALDTPLRAVAQELRVEAAKWDNQNPIISSVENIGSCFERLSLFHNELKLRPTPEAKKGFIMAARDIVTHSNELVTPAKVVADGCTDNRMVRNLTGTLDRLSTLAQQLKIVAAVKASSPGDRDQDAQLIHCGQNLMQAIKGCMRECDAVSIKQHSVAIKFVKINPDMAAPLVPQGFKKTKRVYRPVSMLPTGRSPSVRKSLLGALAK
jgi:vinculin